MSVQVGRSYDATKNLSSYAVIANSRRVIGFEGEHAGVAARFHDFPPQIVERIVTRPPRDA